MDHSYFPVLKVVLHCLLRKFKYPTVLTLLQLAASWKYPNNNCSYDTKIDVGIPQYHQTCCKTSVVNMPCRIISCQTCRLVSRQTQWFHTPIRHFFQQQYFQVVGIVFCYNNRTQFPTIDLGQAHTCVDLIRTLADINFLFLLNSQCYAATS